MSDDLDSPMTKREFLELLRNLVEVSYHMELADDDPSGLATRYIVDQGKLLKAIDAEMKRGDPDPWNS